MKRSVAVAAATTAIVVVGLSGCSHDKSSSAGASGSSDSSLATAGRASSTAKVTVDGKDQHVRGTVACTTAAGNVNIAIGAVSDGVGAVLTDASAPSVKSVGLGDVNAVPLGYTSGVPGAGNATATKHGNTYKITGTATGVDVSKPTQPVHKSFQIEVTCPSSSRSP